MTTETTTRTETLRRLAMAATPGPWKVYRMTDGSTNVFVADDKTFIAEIGHATHPNVTQDARYIAAVDPATVTALLDVVDAARALRAPDLEARARRYSVSSTEPDFLALRSALDRLAALDTPGGQE